VIVYGADSTVERANAAAMQLYGFNPVRMSQQEITQRLAFTTLDGNPIPLEEVPSSRALRGEMVNGFALRVQNPAGQESWVEVSTAPLHNGSEMSGAVVVWHDISVREQLLEAHRRQKDLLLSIFQADPGGLAVLIGPDLVYQYANPAYLQMTGSPDEDPTGRRFYDLWMGEGADRQALILKTTFERGEPAQPGLVRYTHPDGSFRHYSFYAQPILWEGQAAVLSVLWDNTELEGTRDEAVRAAHEASHRM
jgi:PAS domain S-box-containing protein